MNVMNGDEVAVKYSKTKLTFGWFLFITQNTEKLFPALFSAIEQLLHRDGVDLSGLGNTQTNAVSKTFQNCFANSV